MFCALRRLLPLLAAASALSGVAGTAVAQEPGAPAPGPCGPPTDPPARLQATIPRTGLVDLALLDTPRGPVAFFECVGEQAVPLGVRVSPDQGLTVLPGAARWQCGRRERTFAAETTLPDGSPSRGRAAVRTPPCATRFTVSAPPRVQVAQQVTVRVADTWLAGGFTTRLCVTDPRGRRQCAPARFADGRTVVTRRFRAARTGTWTLDLQVGTAHVRAAVVVGRTGPVRPPLPVVLATGDSTIWGVDDGLRKGLRGAAKVVGDPRPAFSMSLANGWLQVARAQVAALRPAVVVMSLGAGEGYPMKGADGLSHSCCDDAWIAEYARRVGQVIQIYRRGGRTDVFYETISALKRPAAQRIVAAVNQAIVRAGAAMPEDVTVLRSDLLFSPNGYQETIRYEGRTVRIRRSDGVHLNSAGAGIEGREAAKAIRARWAQRRKAAGPAAAAGAPGARAAR